MAPIRRRTVLTTVLILAVLGLAAALLAARLHPRVAVEQGRLEGAFEGGVDVFRGVPFAAAPVGPLRWRPPQPAASWTGVRDAVRPRA